MTEKPGKEVQTMQIKIRADSVHIEGYVNAVGRDSRTMTDEYGYPYHEVIEPGAFRAALETEDGPIPVYFDHDATRVIGTEGQNVTLEEDTIGLHIDADFTNPDVMQKARDGRLRGWSFGFIPLDTADEYSEMGRRSHVKELSLVEVSLIDDAMIPVYAGTSVHTRADGKEEKVLIRANDNEVITKYVEERAESPEIASPDNQAEEHRAEETKPEKVVYDAYERQIEILNLNARK